MAMTIELLISGLAVFYRSQREDFWHTIFLCDAEHPVNFRDKAGADWKPLHIEGRDRFITISANQARMPRSLRGKGFDQILNMARPEMHGDGNLTVEKSGMTDVISMIIPAAKLGMTEETPYPYYVINNTTGKYYNVGAVARKAKATIKLNKGNGLTMLVQDGIGTSEIAHIPYKNGATYVLEFRNDCGLDSKAENDFIRYYDWIKDKDGTTFWAGRIDGALAEAEEKNEIEMKSLDELVSILSPQNGNCDIVKIEPPPPNQP
jgi:hypothetical protein